jgi:hypothetical protein
LAAVLAALCAAPALAPAQPPPVPTTSAAEPGVDDLVAVLMSRDPAISQRQRDEAALRLVGRRQPNPANDPINPIILGRLQDFSVDNLAAQVAIVRALGADPAPNPKFIEPLGVVISSDKSNYEAADAARALANYGPKALDQLRSLGVNDTLGTKQRSATIKAIGQIVNKAAARILVEDFLQQPNLNAQLRQAACDALSLMTGEAQDARDGQQ